MFQEEESMVQFWFCFKDGFENLEKLRLNFSKCILSPSLPSGTTEISRQSHCSC